MYEKYTIKYLAKKIKKNCAELVRQTVLSGCYNIYRSLKREYNQKTHHRPFWNSKQNLKGAIIST